MVKKFARKLCSSREEFLMEAPLAKMTHITVMTNCVSEQSLKVILSVILIFSLNLFERAFFAD